jgi:3-oxoacyl-[acyl-carrier protein] reductase
MARTVMVSGGGTGIGRAVAARFAQDGDHVVLIGRRERILADTAEAIGDNASYLAADLAEVQDAQRLADTVAERFGTVDVIVANAGGNIALQAPDRAPEGLAGISWTWTENLRLNVLTAVHLVEGLKPLLNDHGRILLFSSIAAYRGSGSGSYAAAKAALHPYAIDLSNELGARGITANVIAPGYIQDTEFFGEGISPQRRAWNIDLTHTKQPGTPADIAALAHLLAAREGGNITAQIIQSNGGALAGR